MVFGYPPELREKIRIVEETREERLKQVMKRLSLEEREQLVRKYHPDYRSDTKRPVRIGANRGEVIYNEVVDLLEAWPAENPDDVDLTQIDYDVDLLIIGGGGAAAAAALWAIYSGVDPSNILIATKLRFGDANTVKAQGGIQAADRPNDSPARHFLDTFGGGHFANRPELVKALVRDAPFIIKWLEDLGVMFDKTGEGEMIENAGGGASRKRLHAARDYTGLEIMRVMRDEVWNYGVHVVEFQPAIELLTDPETGAVSGAVLWNLETHEYKIARAKVTILATGGFGRLHLAGFPTTNHYGATADGVVLAYRVGAYLRDMDSAQFHPTGVAWPEAILGELITEKCRGLGAHLVNVEGKRFIRELEPRDVVASAIIRECREGRGVITPTGKCGVWLDLPLIDIINGPGTIKRYLPAMYRQFKRQGIDITREPVLTYPTLHYQNGGVAIDPWTHVLNKEEEWIRGLLAAGEVTGGVHGKNRLMGNSLLDITVFGRRAGITAAKIIKETTAKPKLSLKHVEKYMAELEKLGVPKTRRAPRILPDYRGKHVVIRSLFIPY